MSAAKGNAIMGAKKSMKNLAQAKALTE